MDLDDYNCVLCNLDCEETSFHLFFKCPFSGACWSTINNDQNTNLSALDMILEAREDFGNANFREKLSHLAGLFGLQEMELFSTMVKSTSTNRRGNSNQNLDQCAPKPRPRDSFHLTCGEIAFPSFLFCFWAWQPFMFMLVHNHSFI